MSSTERPRARSLGTTLIVWFIVASSGIVLLTAGMAWFALFNGMAWRDDQVLETRADSIRAVLMKAVLDRAELDREVNEDLEGPRQLFVRLIAPASIGAHETPGFPEKVAIDQFPQTGGLMVGHLYQKRIRLGDQEYLGALELVRLPPHAGGGTASILMALDTSADLDVVDRYSLLIVVIVLFGVALSIFVGLAVIRMQLRPLQRLREETEKIDLATLDHRISAGDMPEELQLFVDQFNNMIGRLERAYHGLRRYADDVAHELRTPLNRIQLGAEMALSEDRPAAEYRQTLETTFSECAHLSGLVRSLLFIAAAEHGATRIAAERFNLAGCLEKIHDFFSHGANDHGVTLTLSCDPSLDMQADATLVQRAVVNLVANALSHTPRGGRISIDAREEASDVVIEVADTGEGISPEDQPHVFDRFFHRDSNVQADKGRLGLGLAITKSIIDLHGGQVQLQSTLGKGTRFTLRFPKSIAAAAA